MSQWAAFSRLKVPFHLYVPIGAVEVDPRTPGVAFRARNLPWSHPAPDLRALGGEAGVRTFAAVNGWQVVGNCR